MALPDFTRAPIVPTEHSPWLPLDTPMGTGRLNKPVASTWVLANGHAGASVTTGMARICPVTTAETGTPSRLAGSPGTPGTPGVELYLDLTVRAEPNRSANYPWNP